MKRAVSLAVLLLMLAVMLTGCGNGWIRMVNLQNRAIVQGVGVDWDGEEFIITMQVFSPEGSGGQTMVDASKENAQVITCRGASIAEAVEKSALNQGKEFYLGHNRIVILGWEAAQRPLKSLLSYFVSSLDSRPDVSLLVTKGQASELISASITQSILPAMSIENTVSNAERNGLTEEVYLIDVLEAMSYPHRSTWIPFIEIADGVEEEKDLRTIQIGGMGIFSQDGYVGELTTQEVQGLLFLRDKMQGVIYTLETEEYERAAVQLYHSNTRLVPEIDGDTVIFRAEIRGEWMLVEKRLRDGQLFTEQSLDRLEETLSEKIRSDCEKAFRRTVVDYGSDVFYGGDMVWREQPKLWQILEEEWPSGIGGDALTCDIQVEIDRTGLEGVVSEP